MIERRFVPGVLLASAMLFAWPARADGVDEDKQRGNQAMSEMNYGDALIFYKKALERNPSDASLHYNIGRAHQAREEYPEAQDALEQFQKHASPEVLAKVPALAQLLADVRSRVGAVRLRCSEDAPNAEVAIGDKTRVKGCAREPKVVRFSVPAKSGAVEVKLTDEKLQSQAARVTIEGGRPPAEVALQLVPKVSSGILVLRATPGSATIAVDGVPRGNSPVEVPLPAASHTAEITADGYEARRIPFVLQAGEKKELDLSLDKKAPVTSKWWFWTGAAVAVAGLATVGYIVIAQPEKSPGPPGNIQPGLVRQGLSF